MELESNEHETDLDSLNEVLESESLSMAMDLEEYMTEGSWTDLDTSRDDIICYADESDENIVGNEGNTSWKDKELQNELNKTEIDLNTQETIQNTFSYPSTGVEVLNIPTINIESSEFDYRGNTMLEDVCLRGDYGIDEQQEKIRDSVILPPLCTAELGDAVVNLLSRIEVFAVDYQGKRCTVGGDPIVVQLLNENDEIVNTNVDDMNNGIYEITFTPQTIGRHKLVVSFFDRQIQGSPFLLDVKAFNEPVLVISSAITETDRFKQPANVLVDKQGYVYVLDSGNCRICVFDGETGEYVNDISGVGFEKQGTTGFTVYPNGHLMTVNWRTRIITERNPMDENFARKLKCEELKLPTDIAVTSRGELIVVDEGTGEVLILDPDGFLKYKVKLHKNEFSLNCQRFVTVCHKDHILVADNVITEYSRSGKYRRTIAATEESDGYYSGIAVDGFGNILASKSYKGQGWIEVYNSERQLINVIESYHDKLRRPGGLGVSDDFYVFVADLGRNCIKKYRYK